MPHPVMLLDGKVAIVSGRRPGPRPGERARARRARARRSCSRHAAPTTSSRCSKEIEADGGRALAVPTNLVDAEQVAALVERDRRHASAGSTSSSTTRSAWTGANRSSRSISTHWRKVYDVNVWGALGLTQACVPHLRAQPRPTHGDASIVFILSMSMRKVRANEGAYSTSKAALRTAVQALALELGPARVRVERGRAGMDRRPERRDVHPMGVAEPRRSAATTCAREIEARIPLGDDPPQDEIAHSVVFFASPWSKVITGQTLDVNGGEWFA